MITDAIAVVSDTPGAAAPATTDTGASGAWPSRVMRWRGRPFGRMAMGAAALNLARSSSGIAQSGLWLAITHS